MFVGKFESVQYGSDYVHGRVVAINVFPPRKAENDPENHIYTMVFAYDGEYKKYSSIKFQIDLNQKSCTATVENQTITLTIDSKTQNEIKGRYLCTNPSDCGTFELSSRYY